MTLTELQNEVIALTKRPDLTTMITTAIKAATLKLHQMEFFSKDLLETQITFPSSDYTQSFAYTTTFPRWRALKYLRKIDSTSGLPYDASLTVITPEQILDNYAQTKTNVVYEAGQILQIRTYEQVQSFVIGLYQSPDITTYGYTSWIAQFYPYAIIFDAAATVFKSIGFGDMEASMRLLVSEQKQILLTNNIQAEGY